MVAADTSRSTRATSGRLSQRKTSRPQLPKRGLTTSGGSISGTSPARTWTVAGCGTPAAVISRAVRSLSWAASSARAVLMTGTPLRSSHRSSSRPGSTPASVGVTSIRASATDPGPIRLRASVGAISSASMPRARHEETSMTFVSFALEPRTATCGVVDTTIRVSSCNWSVAISRRADSACGLATRLVA